MEVIYSIYCTWLSIPSQVFYVAKTELAANHRVKRLNLTSGIGDKHVM